VSWQSWNYLIPYLISLAISAGVAFYAWRNRAVAGASMYALTTLTLGSWTLGYILELTSSSLEAKIFWDNVQFAGEFFAPVAFLAFVSEFTGYRPSSAKRTWGAQRLCPASSCFWRSRTTFMD